MASTTVIGRATFVRGRVSGEGEVLDLTHSVATMRLRQVMCAPVSVRGRPLGVIYVDSTLGGPAFTRADLWLFHAQAGLMGLAIENNRLIRETLQAREMSHQLRVARDVVSRSLSVRETEALVKKATTPETPKPEKTVDVHTRAAEDKLRLALGTRVRINRKGKGGRIEIEFMNEDELQRIYERLTGE